MNRSSPMLIKSGWVLISVLAALQSSCAVPPPQAISSVEEVTTPPPFIYAVDPPLPSELPPLLPPEPGEKSGLRNTFAKCGPCHSLVPGRNRIGPSLAGAYGRKAGAGTGFRYSEGMASSGLVWDVATLDRYLTRPRDVVPAGKMTFSGLSDPAARAEVIAYLQRF